MNALVYFGTLLAVGLGAFVCACLPRVAGIAVFAIFAYLGCACAQVGLFISAVAYVLLGAMFAWITFLLPRAKTPKRGLAP